MTRYGIIADDLTGATDAAVPFAQAGFHTVVVLDGRGMRGVDAEIIALSTHSRHDLPHVARRKVRDACEFLRKEGYQLLYKKMDSTVQGNIIGETEAVRDLTGCKTALVCPANPGQGRVVRDGVLWVRGKRLASLPRLFSKQGLGAFDLVTTPVTAAKVRRALGGAPPFVIADATNDRELATLARTARAWRQPVLLAGSAGMAAQVARLVRGESSPHQKHPPGLRPGSRQANAPSQGCRRFTLVLCGSRNRVTEAQLKHLAGRLDPLALPCADGLGESVAPALISDLPVVVRIPIYLQPDKAILDNLRKLSSHLRTRSIGALLLSGGDTARLICRWLRPRGIELHGEIKPGLPWGRLLGGLADGVAVCTKPGGFGDENGLAEAVEFLSRKAKTPARGRRLLMHNKNRRSGP
jgi:uncharacterized protein YgbK (DUF1537 family)